MARVLIVDDSPYMRMILKDILYKHQKDPTILEAEDGQEAKTQYLEMFQKNQKPDLVLMDINMPLMGGIESLQAIRKIDPEALVIMCSAQGSRKKVIQALELGAKYYIIKPFEEKKVLHVLSKYLP